MDFLRLNSLFLIGAATFGCTTNPSSSTDMALDSAATDSAAGDSAVAPNQVMGSIGGSTFAAEDSIFVTANATGFDFNGISTVIEISDFAGACAKEAANQGVKNGRSLVLVIGAVDGSGNATPASATGAYTVGSGMLAKGLDAEVYYQQVGTDCLKASTESAASGTVTVTQVDGSAVAGTFDATFAADHVTGTFSAPVCASFNPNRTPNATCQ